MPIYEYHCKDCKKHFEILQKISEGAKRKCTECGGKLEKLVSQSAFHLKGSGWYKTDYADKSKQKSGEQEGKKEEKNNDKKEPTPDKKEKKPEKSTKKDKKK